MAAFPPVVVGRSSGETTRPYVSVVIPALNEELLLPQCLQSLRQQRLEEPWEIIVVDNGSTDRTAEVARAWGARVISCPRRGVAYARQAGLEAARGGIVVQLDADTALPPDALRRIVAWFKDPDVAAVVGDAEYHPGSPATWGLRTWYRTLNSLAWRLRHRPIMMQAGCCSVRRAALLQAGGYNQETPHYGDEQGVLPRLAGCGRIIWDPGVVVQSSDRRFRGRLLRWVFLDLLFHTLVDMFIYHLTGRSSFGDRQAIRAPVRPHGPGSARRGPRGWALRTSLVLVVALVGIGLYGIFSPQTQVFGKTYSHARAGARQVALTFDDGPNEPYTSQVLDILKREHIRATFFLVGMNAERHPETLARMLAEGHVVGNHTWAHRPQAALAPGGCHELVKGQAAIARLTGVRPALFRPPYGLKTPWWLACARRNNLVTVMWNVEARDPHRPPASAIVERIVRGVHPGAIILLHDGDETRDNSDRSHTVEALPKIIAELRTKGYKFVTVSDLLNRAPYQAP